MSIRAVALNVVPIAADPSQLDVKMATTSPSEQIARELIKQHGCKAGVHAAERVSQLLAASDEDELSIWLDVMAWIAALLSEESLKRD